MSTEIIVVKCEKDGTIIEHNEMFDNFYEHCVNIFECFPDIELKIFKGYVKDKDGDSLIVDISLIDDEYVLMFSYEQRQKIEKAITKEDIKQIYEFQITPTFKTIFSILEILKKEEMTENQHNLLDLLIDNINHLFKPIFHQYLMNTEPTFQFINYNILELVDDLELVSKHYFRDFKKIAILDKIPLIFQAPEFITKNILCNIIEYLYYVNNENLDLRIELNMKIIEDQHSDMFNKMDKELLELLGQGEEAQYYMEFKFSNVYKSDSVLKNSFYYFIQKMVKMTIPNAIIDLYMENGHYYIIFKLKYIKVDGVEENKLIENCLKTLKKKINNNIIICSKDEDVRIKFGNWLKEWGLPFITCTSVKELNMFDYSFICTDEQINTNISKLFIKNIETRMDFFESIYFKLCYTVS